MFYETKLKQSYHPATGVGGLLVLVVARPELLPGSTPFLGPLKVEFLFLLVTATVDPSLYFHQFVKQPLNKTWGKLGQTHMMSYTADGSI